MIRAMRDRGRERQHTPRIKQEIKREKRGRPATVVTDDERSDGDSGDVANIAERKKRKRPRQSHDSGIEVVDLS